MLCCLRPVWILLAPTQSPRASLFLPPVSEARSSTLRSPAMQCGSATLRTSCLDRLRICPMNRESLDRHSAPSDDLNGVGQILISLAAGDCHAPPLLFATAHLAAREHPRHPPTPSLKKFGQAGHVHNRDASTSPTEGFALRLETNQDVHLAPRICRLRLVLDGAGARDLDSAEKDPAIVVGFVD
jgi:hypothetical protein